MYICIEIFIYLLNMVFSVVFFAQRRSREILRRSRDIQRRQAQISPCSTKAGPFVGYGGLFVEAGVFFPLFLEFGGFFVELNMASCSAKEAATFNKDLPSLTMAVSLGFRGLGV